MFRRPVGPLLANGKLDAHRQPRESPRNHCKKDLQLEKHPLGLRNLDRHNLNQNLKLRLAVIDEAAASTSSSSTDCWRALLKLQRLAQSRIPTCHKAGAFVSDFTVTITITITAPITNTSTASVTITTTSVITHC